MASFPTNSVVHTMAEIVDAVCEQHGLPAVGGTQVRLADHGVTSMAMVDLMMAVEARFDIEIPRADLNAENFRNIETMAAMVDRLRANLAA